MACGCAILGGDVEPVREFITDHRTGRLVSPLDPKAVADGVADLLENTALAKKLRHAARRYAEQNLDIQQHLRAYEARIAEIVG